MKSYIDEQRRTYDPDFNVPVTVMEGYCLLLVDIWNHTFFFFVFVGFIDFIVEFDYKSIQYKQDKEPIKFKNWEDI